MELKLFSPLQDVNCREYLVLPIFYPPSLPAHLLTNSENVKMVANRGSIVQRLDIFIFNKNENSSTSIGPTALQTEFYENWFELFEFL